MLEIIRLSDNIAIILGIKVKEMTFYKAELIHLKNENITDKKICEMINKELKLNLAPVTINQWISQDKQPKNIVIKFLERRLLNRVKKATNNIINPHYDLY